MGSAIYLMMPASIINGDNQMSDNKPNARVLSSRQINEALQFASKGYCGKFASCIGDAWVAADNIHRERIVDAFPEVILHSYNQKTRGEYMMGDHKTPEQPING